MVKKKKKKKKLEKKFEGEKTPKDFNHFWYKLKMQP